MTTKRSSKIAFRALSLACTLGFTLPATAATIYVNASAANCSTADGSAAKPFCTIQAGVTAAASGDTVQVAAGTYSGDVNVANKSLQILGADPHTTTVQAANMGFNMTGFTAQGVVEIANFTITDGTTAGVACNSSNLSCLVHNCILSGNAVHYTYL